MNIPTDISLRPIAAADDAAMYFLAAARGLGQGRRLLQHCLAAARQFGYRRCYLETLTGMHAAQHLYVDAGFEQLCCPLGATGRFACDRYYALDL